METYDPLMGALEDYAELIIQYGYVTLFVSAFPLAPLLALISNYVEIRMDGSKLLYNFRWFHWLIIDYNYDINMYIYID